MKEFSMLEHSDYRVLDTECSCFICTEWRQAYVAYQHFATLVRFHRRGCRCTDCRSHMKTRSTYLAAMNRRDLYCESSFHAQGNPRWGPIFMEWVTAKIVSGYTDGWWERTASALPLINWFYDFDRAAVQAMSGMTILRMLLS